MGAPFWTLIGALRALMEMPFLEFKAHTFLVVDADAGRHVNERVNACAHMLRGRRLQTLFVGTLVLCAIVR